VRNPTRQRAASRRKHADGSRYFSLKWNASSAVKKSGARLRDLRLCGSPRGVSIVFDRREAELRSGLPPVRKSIAKMLAN
jgi:hypothetical protein